MGKINSRLKGKTGELELASELRKIFGANARRGQQFSGSYDSPDIVHNIDGLHIECKRTEKLNLYAAMEQAKRDAGDKTPVVCHRKNRRDWVMVIELARLKDLIEIFNKFNEE